MADPLNLEDHIRLCMAETQMRIGADGPCCADLAAALASDAAMLTEATNLVAGTATLERRDHITRWRNSLLRRAMGV